ncbi:AraC family transcriptional regulator [Ruminiclostridium papyrosolvens]|nr:AraC family transcriptional regulator [Ruminiclostridium papyrosolvens]
MCGINNITYFHKLFKKHVNMTPANFRERFGFTKAKYKL